MYRCIEFLMPRAELAIGLLSTAFFTCHTCHLQCSLSPKYHRGTCKFAKRRVHACVQRARQLLSMPPLPVWIHSLLTSQPNAPATMSSLPTTTAAASPK